MAASGRQKLQIAWDRTPRMESRTLNLYAEISCKSNPCLKSFVDHNNLLLLLFIIVVSDILFRPFYNMFATINILFTCLIRLLLFHYLLSFFLVKNSSRKFFREGTLPPIRAPFVGESRRKVKSLVTPAWGYRKKWRTVGQHSCQASRCNFHDAIKFCKKLRKKNSAILCVCFFLPSTRSSSTSLSLS